MAIRKVNLQRIMGDMKGFEQTLGPEEYRILEDASQLLKSQFPTSEPDRLAYITRSTHVQNGLINLYSNVAYVWNMLKIERDSHWGRLMYREEYEGNARDKEAIALSRDDKLRDLHETIVAFEALKSTVDNLLWSIKMTMQRL